MDNLKKTDLVVALIIGEVAALLMVLIGNNLAGESDVFKALAPYLNYLLIIFPIACAAGLYVAHILSRFIEIIYQFAKFVLVGGLNFLIDMGVLNFLIFYTGISTGLVQSGFKGISFLVATTNSYFWNKHWTFGRKNTGSSQKEFLVFLIVSTIGFLINLSVDYVVVNLISPIGDMNPKIWAQFGGLIASIVALSWNFIGYKFIVFKQKPKTDFGSLKI